MDSIESVVDDLAERIANKVTDVLQAARTGRLCAYEMHWRALDDPRGAHAHESPPRSAQELPDVSDGMPNDSTRNETERVEPMDVHHTREARTPSEVSTPMVARIQDDLVDDRITRMERVLLDASATHAERLAEVIAKMDKVHDRLLSFELQVAASAGGSA